MRKPIIAGNWKLNKTNPEAVDLTAALVKSLRDVDDVDVVVCPVFTALSEVSKLLKGSNVGLGAQNLYWAENGAFTGEVSAPLLKSAGVQYVIIGHSERRQFFGETNEGVNKKIKAALAGGLIPIVCVGEILEERESGKTFDIIRSQCEGAFIDLVDDDMNKIIIAYEPVWAIGTGKTASPQQAQEVHQFIRDWLEKTHSKDVADHIRIQYGGSVKPDNISELIAQNDIDGALVGGASLNVESFVALVKNTAAINT